MPKLRKKKIINQMKAEFLAVSENERLSRAVVSALTAQLDVTVEELADVRCAVSEAVTNAIVHAYRESVPRRGARATVYILITLYDDRSIKIVVRDKGCGIADLHRAMEPQFTSDDTGERSGMGFSIMQSFMDCVRVRSAPGKGTTVELRKVFSRQSAAGSGASDPPLQKENVDLRCEAEEIA